MIQKFNFRHTCPISSPRVCLKASLNMGGWLKMEHQFHVSFLFERIGRDSQPGIFVWRVPASLRLIEEIFKKQYPEAWLMVLVSKKLEIRFVPTC